MQDINFAQPYHTIAVDKNIIPYGTRVKIEGYGDTIFVAEDCGGKSKRNACRRVQINTFRNSKCAAAQKNICSEVIGSY